MKTHTELCYNSIVIEVAGQLHQQAQKIPAKDNLPTNCLKKTPQNNESLSLGAK